MTNKRNRKWKITFEHWIDFATVSQRKRARVCETSVLRQPNTNHCRLNITVFNFSCVNSKTSFPWFKSIGKQSDSLRCARFRRSKTIEFNRILKGVICLKSFAFDWNGLKVLSVHICTFPFLSFRFVSFWMSIFWTSRQNLLFAFFFLSYSLKTRCWHRSKEWYKMSHVY